MSERSTRHTTTPPHHVVIVFISRNEDGRLNSVNMRTNNILDVCLPHHMLRQSENAAGTYLVFAMGW